MSPAVGIWIALLSLVLSGVLSTLAHALSQSTRAGLEQWAARRGKPMVAVRMAAIANDAEHHLAALALPRAILNLTVVVFLVLWVTSTRDATAPATIDHVIGILIAGVLVWLVTVVIPLAVSEHAAERTVVAGSWLIRAFGVVLAPVRPLLRFVMEVVRRLAGEQAQTAAEALEAEIMSVVEEGEREGQLDEVARDMIEAVVEFRSTTVEQIMTPRTEMTALEYTDDLARVKELTRKFGHSRVPVYEENLDHIVGILYLKDLLRWIVEHGSDNDAQFTLRDVLRPAMFVPETKTVRELLTELLAAKVHISIVADEYGGTSGLATIEDIVEEIVGEIQDEYEPEEDGPAPVLVDQETRSAEVDGRTEIDEANDELEDVGIELPEHPDYDTVGGFVVVTLGRIPDPGEQFERSGLLVTVLDAEPTRVKRVKLELTSPNERPPEAEAQPSEQAVK